MLLRASNYMFRRLLRGYLGLAILVVLPLALISVIGLVVGDGIDPKLGIPAIDGVAMIIIFAFQLFGGNYTLDFLRSDLFSPRKWRLYSLPYPPFYHALSILISSSLFSALQGFAMVLYTHWVYRVRWGSFLSILVLLVFFSALNQLVYMLIALGVKSDKLGERLGEVYGLGSFALAGIWFQLPNTTVFNFLTKYGNPLSLSRNVMLYIMTGRYGNEALYSLAILLLASVALVWASIYFGRRKLA
ncbi:MAG TPA: ABC transporter permease [Firmicutes bacterium]|jgi:ABC-2 type transport system permease protein|nr:MAG: ABC transporter [Peptococcaceae bacterium 1109]HHT74223.1 ABC transporter permease [Bacillota bacterium]